MDQISGTAAGVPFLALAPEGDPDRSGPAVLLWHLLGAPGTPAAMASSLPLQRLAAWRIYLELPGTGSRPIASGSDLLLDGYAPIVEHAVAELPLVLADLRTRLPIAEGPAALVGGSGGGHAALLATARHAVPVAAVAAVNPAIRAESVMAVNERASGNVYHWSEESRLAAAELDLLAAAREFAGTAVLLLTGSEEYPEFRPDQQAFRHAVREHADRMEHEVIDGLAHMFAEDPGLEPAPPTECAQVLDTRITDWFGRYLPGASS